MDLTVRLTIILITSIHVFTVVAKSGEPLCLSRYDYDHKVLRDIVAIETKLGELGRTVDKQADLIEAQERTMEQMRQSHKDAVNQLEQRIKQTATATGSTYVHWGRSACPQGNGTQIIYSGYGAGSEHQHTGGGTNYLCLPASPTWGVYDDTLNGGAYLYGAEYEIFGAQSRKFFKQALGDHDMPCAVCRSERPISLMVPGRNECLGGWTLEYSGYLVTGHYNHVAASEFVCLDGEAETIPGGKTSDNGKLLYIVEGRCGSLKCPPYVEGREITCAVCTI